MLTPFPANQTLHILSLPKPLSPSRQLDFVNQSEQLAYFNQYQFTSIRDCTFVRDRNVLRIPGPCTQYYNCNYCYWQDTSFGASKYWFAYITDITYNNVDTTFIQIQVDPFQTFMFDYTIPSTFIERMHPNSNSAMDNYVPESIEFGSAYQTYDSVEAYFESGAGVAYMVVSTIDLTKELSAYGDYENPKSPSAKGGVILGLPTACDIYGTTDETQISLLFQLMVDLPWVAKGIIGITAIPQALFDYMGFTPVTLLGGLAFNQTTKANSAQRAVTIENWKSHFPSYRFGKMYCYPYSVIEITANTGQIITVRPEMIIGNDINIGFEFYFNIVPEIRVFIMNYAGGHNNQYENMICIGNFPLMPIQDTTSLLTKSQSQIMTTNYNQLAYTNLELTNLKLDYQEDAAVPLAGLGVAGNLAGLNVTGATKEVANYFMNQVDREFQRQSANINTEAKAELATKKANMTTAVPTLTGMQGGEANYLAYDKFSVKVNFKTILPNFSTIVDSFFNAYGYRQCKTGDVIMSRSQPYTYVKTIDAQISGRIPTQYRDMLRSMYDNGITVWHNASQFGEYS